jgi:RyR domain-containing protein
MRYSDDQIAEAIHTVNGLLQRFHGEASPQPQWADAGEAMRERVRALVRGYKAGMTPRQGHERWCDAMAADGWRYGPRKDPELRTHPCMVAYSELPACQQIKNAMSLQITMVLMAAGA